QSHFQILIHFLETTPSILRMTCVMLVYLPTLTILVIYSYHILIIILTMIDGRSKLPFSLYLFDLMPNSEREQESEREDSEEDEQLL
ncbi:hypothetical protein PMAYCL1PPCAC_07774, partial [Pristionchus mayeri]